MATPYKPVKLLDQWGREVDQSWFSTNIPAQENPDPTTSDEYWDISNNPHIIAGMEFSSVAHLFVTARGLDDEKTGNYYPPQLMFTTPELASDEILDFAGWQFDEEFEGGFGETIRSTDGPCKLYGHQVIELEWYRRESPPWKGKVFAKMAWARDPAKYKYDIDGKPGIYKVDGAYTTPVKMNPNNFISYAYNPLFNNPYGQSINRPLKPWIETFSMIFGYWRHALEKAGMGSWVAHAPDAWFSQSSGKVQRELLDAVMTKVKLIASGTYSVFPESARLENQKLTMEAQAFLDWYTSFCEVVSLIYTGTTGALKEEQYGSRSAKESTDVREKSQKELMNASRVGNFWTWKFIPLLINLNFPPSQVRSYPTLFLIPPNLQTPTTPKDQDTAQEITDGTSDNADEKTQEKIDARTKKTDTKNAEMQAPLWIRNTEDVHKLQKQMLAGENIDESPYVVLSTGTNNKIVFGRESDFIASPVDDGPRIIPVTELQDEETPEPVPPVAIPAGYEDFPRDDPLDDDYRSALDYAHDALAAMPVKEYANVTKEDAPWVFTVKRFRGYESDMLPVLKLMKTALDISLDEPTEKTAWEAYFELIVPIFAAKGIPMDPSIRNDLNISFRQTRQNVLNEGFIQMALQDESVKGFEIVPNPNVKQHHLDEIAWYGKVIPKDHVEMQRGGRLRPPLNFGCVCHLARVSDASLITPESEWPADFPGKTYQYYAQPEPQELSDKEDLEHHYMDYVEAVRCGLL